MDRLREWLELPLLSAGETRITLWSLAYVLVLVTVLFWGAKRLQRWIAGRLLARSSLDAGARHTAGALARYTLLAVGLLLIVQTAGIDLTTFHVLAGAIGIGIGFGLQNVVSNFFAGLIIMFERPIKLGDRIELD